MTAGAFPSPVFDLHPSFPMANKRDHRGRDSESFRKSAQGSVSSILRFDRTNLSYLLLCKLCVAILGTLAGAWRDKGAMASSRHTISGVVEGRSSVEMRASHAESEVTAVEDSFSFGNRTYLETERDTMSAIVRGTSHPNDPVSVLAGFIISGVTSFPSPAPGPHVPLFGAFLVYSLPESVG